MAVMFYEEWLRRSRAGPRGPWLLAVDRTLKAYTVSPGALRFNALHAAVMAWMTEEEKAGKDVTSSSYRFNTNDAVTDLLVGLVEDQEGWDANPKEMVGKATLAAAKSHIARMDRPANFSNSVKIGKMFFDRKKLKPAKFPSKMLRKIVRHPAHPNVSFEGFSEGELAAGVRGWNDVLACNEQAIGLRAGSFFAVPVHFETWFGAADDAARKELRKRAKLFDLALRTRPITFVRRKSYEIHYVDKQVDPLGATEDETHSNGTYGYVWSAGNHTGGGVRVILYQKPFDEPCPYEGIAQTMIHELSHKFLGTDDEPVGGGPDVYGVAACKALAKKDPKSARNLADCWGYYYISAFKPL